MGFRRAEGSPGFGPTGNEIGTIREASSSGLMEGRVSQGPSTVRSESRTSFNLRQEGEGIESLQASWKTAAPRKRVARKRDGVKLRTEEKVIAHNVLARQG